MMSFDFMFVVGDVIGLLIKSDSDLQNQVYVHHLESEGGVMSKIPMST